MIATFSVSEEVDDEEQLEVGSEGQGEPEQEEDHPEAEPPTDQNQQHND